MNLCIFQLNRSAYSETFIQAHIDLLPGRKTVLWGDRLPGSFMDGAPVNGRLPRWIYALRHRLPSALQSYATKLPETGFRDLLRRERIDAVLAEYGVTGKLVAPACRIEGIPLVVHFHGYDAYQSTTLEWNGNYREVFETAAAVVAVSEDMRAQLGSLGCPGEKLLMNTYGVDVKRFRLSSAGEAPPSFLAVGRFVDKKAPYLTLLAFEKVCRAVPQARLVFIGDGPLLDCCRQLAAAHGIEQNVEFRGVQPSAEVAAAMAGARAFVQHSIRPGSGDSEGTPVALLEAGASGLPAVATRHGGIRDVIEHEVNGFLVDERDVEGMARYMIRLAKDPQLAGRMGLAARERIEANYSMERSISVLGAAIEKAAASRVRK